MAKLHFEIDMLPGGWATIIFATPEDVINLSVSYLFDGIDRLLTAVLLLNKGLKQTECSLMNEPGGHIISFENSNGTITLRIYASETWSDRPLKDIEKHCQLAYETSCTLKQLNNQLTNGFYNLLCKYGKEGYQEKWNNDFPEIKYRELQAFTQTTK